MTQLDVLYRYGAAPSESASLAMAKVREVYGVRRMEFDEAKKTVRVEYDASRRAKEQLVNLGLVQADEAPAVSKVLDAAAMTYVAGMLSAILQLLRLIMITNNGRSRR